MLTLITMIIIVHNSPFYSQTVSCNFRQLMTCHWIYLLTYLYFNPPSLTTIQDGICIWVNYWLQKNNNNRLKVLRKIKLLRNTKDPKGGH